MQGFKHLTFHDRLKIEKMKKEGAKQCEIAAAIHTTEGTISRELRRGRYEHTNSDLTTAMRYSPDIAQQRYEDNLAAKGGPLKIGNDHALAVYIEKRIADDKFSPSAVLAEIASDDKLSFSVTICARTLYSYIDKGLFLRVSNKDLPFGGRRRKHQTRHVRAARAPKGESIEKRPEHINDRSEFGHWEMDTVESNRKGRSVLLALTERQARQQLFIKMPDQTAPSVVAKLDLLEYRYGTLFPLIFKSLTVDNGSEFADCEGMERSIFGGKRTQLFYCHPRNPQERGSNEKQNTMLRRHYPKGTNFDLVTDEEIQRATDWINRYPRKLLGWANSQNLFDAALSGLRASP